MFCQVWSQTYKEFIKHVCVYEVIWEVFLFSPLIYNVIYNSTPCCFTITPIFSSNLP